MRKKTSKSNAIPKVKLPKAVGSPLKKQATGGPGIFSNFESAKFSNKRSWIWSSWPTDFKKTMTVFDRLETTRKMRWLELNAGLIRQVLSDMCIYSVGDGIKPQARSGDIIWDSRAENYFRDWGSKSCDITGRFSFYEIQHICCRLMDRDGEVFIVKTRDKSGVPKIQIIESHKIQNSNSASPPDGMVDGIMFDAYGKPTHYNVIQSDGSSRLLPANAVIHLYEPEVASGARAYSPLQHSINNMVDMLEIISLEKFAVKTASDITRTITRENPQFDGTQSDFEAFGMRPQDYKDGLTDPNEASTFIGGKILSLAPGEKLESFESQRPNHTFTGFIEHLQRDSTQGSLPFEFVIDPTKAGGASMRFITAKADRRFGHRQAVMIQRMLTPIYGYIIGDAIASGMIPAIDSWNRVFWTTPKRVTVDAGREAAQNRQDIELGLKTLTEDYAERGMDFHEEVRRRAADAKKIIDIAKEFDVPVSMIWKPTNTSLIDVDQSVDPEPTNPPKVGKFSEPSTEEDDAVEENDEPTPQKEDL
jgi:hypothetical protein